MPQIPTNNARPGLPNATLHHCGCPAMNFNALPLSSTAYVILPAISANQAEMLKKDNWWHPNVLLPRVRSLTPYDISGFRLLENIRRGSASATRSVTVYFNAP